MAGGDLIDATRTHRPTRRQAMSLAALVLACGTATSFATPALAGADFARPTGARVGEATSSAARARLEARAERQREQAAPDAAKGDDLDTVIARLRAARAEAVDNNAAPPTPLEDDAEIALRLYASGRLALEANDPVRARRDLSRAAELDPTSAAILVELARAQRAAGDAPGAAASLEQAAQLGMTDPAAWLTLGQAAAERGETTRAAQSLAEARASIARSRDSGLPYVVNIALGEALLELGEPRAAAEALEHGLDMPERLGAPTEYADGLRSISRRRGALWSAAGDAWANAGDIGRAVEAYARGAEETTIDANALRLRLASAAVSSGRTAEAALVVLDHLTNSTEPASSRTVDVVARIRTADADSAADLAAAIGEFDSTDNTASPARRTGLLRVRAAALPANRSVRVLRGGVLSLAEPGSVLDDLLAEQAAQGGAQSVVREAVTIVGSRPLLDDQIAGAMLGSGVYGGEVLAELDASRGAAAQLLRGRVALRLGLPALDTIAEAHNARAGATQQAAVWRAHAKAAADLGAWAEAERAIDALRAITKESEPRDAQTARALAEALADALESAQRFSEAAAVLDAAPEAVTVGSCVRQARMSAAAGERGQAVSLAEAAVALDPLDERGYAVLLELHNPGGIAEDETKLTDAAIRLREALPSSRLVRQLLARELLARQEFDEAADVLRALADEDPTQAAPVELLAQVWLALGRRGDEDVLEQGRAWLAARRHPDAGRGWASVHLVKAEAAVLTAMGLHTEAIELLESARERLGGSTLLNQMIEQVYRAGLGDETTARRLASERLAGDALSIDRALELAELLAGETPTDRLDGVLLRALRPRAELTTEQRRTLARIAARQAFAVPRTLEADPEAGVQLRRSALQLLGMLETHGIGMPPNLHELRLTMTAAETADVDAVLDVARAFAATTPGRERAALVRGAAALVEADHADKALDYMARLTLDAPALFGGEEPLDGPMFGEWVRLIAQHGTGDDAMRMVVALEQAGAVPRAAELAGVDPSLPIERTEAELIYRIAGLAGLFNESRTAEFLRLVLRLVPDHASAANDLGYGLLEREGPTPEAARLLEHAYELSPNEVNIVDSLGWLRYRQGRLEDGPNGEPGAISLLRRAGELFGESGGRMVADDHLGDALWVSGDRDGAIAAWESAREQAMEELGTALTTGGADTPATKQAKDLINATGRKLRAVQRGQTPPIAPSGNAAGGAGSDED